MTANLKQRDFNSQQEQVLAGFYFTFIISNPNDEGPDPNNPNAKLVSLETSFNLDHLVALQQFIIFYQLLVQAHSHMGNFDHIFKTKDGYGILGPWTKPDYQIEQQLPLLDTVIQQDQMIAQLYLQSVAANAVYDSAEDEARAKKAAFEPIYDTKIALSASFIYHLLTISDLTNLVKHILDLGWQKDHFVPNSDTEQITQTWLDQFPSAITSNYIVVENANDGDMKLRLLIKRKDLYYLQTHQTERLNNFVNDCFNSPKAEAAGIPLWVDYNYQTQQLSVDIRQPPA